MKSTSQFQIILLGVFGFFVIAGVILFSTFQSAGTTNLPMLTLWGTIPELTMRTFLTSDAVLATKVKITYVEKDPTTLDQDFIESLAQGVGPDLVLLPQNLLEKERNKLQEISFKNYPERTFKDTFIEGGELFLTQTGVLGLPFSVDPLVLYWNRTLFSNAGIASPPATWDEVSKYSKLLSVKDIAGNLRQSTIAFGSYKNVTNAKEILATLLLQSGSMITSQDDQGRLVATLMPQDDTTKRVDSAVSFYTGFADPAQEIYSWNRSLESSSKLFLEGSLALYPGFGSELYSIRKRNPNLNFDITLLPQVKNTKVQLTYGRLYGLVIPKRSKNISAALTVATLLTGKDQMLAWAEVSGLPPVRRDLLSITPSEGYQVTLYRSALISKAWRDPAPLASERIFNGLIDSITSGNNEVSEALSNANRELKDSIESTLGGRAWQ